MALLVGRTPSPSIKQVQQQGFGHIPTSPEKSEALEEWRRDEALLALTDMLFRLRLHERVPFQQVRRSARDLGGAPIYELLGHVLQHDGLQREGCLLSSLQERAPAERL